MNTDSNGQDLKERIGDQLFGVQRSSRYHNHRRRFFELWNTTTVTIAALGGISAAYAFHLNGELLAVLIALIVSVTGAFDLAMGGAARRANLHAELARDFVLLEAEFVKSRPTDDDSLNVLIEKRLLIEAREPAKMHLLDAMCHFELLTAQGDTREHPKFPWLRRKLAHWLSQAGYTQDVAATVQHCRKLWK